MNQTTRPQLRFYCRRSAQVTDPHAQDRDHRRCVGRAWREIFTGRFAWVPTGEVEAIDYHADLVMACKDGDLWAADAATAKTCGVPFDPAFDQETTETIKAFRARISGKPEEPKAEEKPKAEELKAEELKASPPVVVIDAETKNDADPTLADRALGFKGNNDKPAKPGGKADQ